MRRVAFIILPFLVVESSFCQTYFDSTYNSGIFSNSNEGIWDAVLDLPNGFIFGSFSRQNGSQASRSWIVQINEVGQTIQTGAYGDSSDVFYALRVLTENDGGYLGFNRYFVLGSSIPSAQFALVKWNSLLEFEWVKFYGDTLYDETAGTIVRCTDSGLCMVGQQVDNLNSTADIYLVRTDVNGNQLWSMTYGGALSEAAHSLLQTPDHGFLLLGWTRSFGAGMRDFYLIKTDSVGNQQWQQTYGTSGMETGESILALSDGNYLMTGGGSNPSGSGSYGRLYKINPSGDIIWSRTYEYPGNPSNSFFRTRELPNGDLVSVGLTHLFNDAGWILKTDSQGNELWQHEYNKNDNTDLFYSILATSDGGFLLSGQCSFPQTTKQDAWLLKVDSCGCAVPGCLSGCVVGTGEEEEQLPISNEQFTIWPNPASEVVRLQATGNSMK
jgi:hypothetical protein